MDRAQLKTGDKLGYDPRLHTPEAVARYRGPARKPARLVAVDMNPVDAIWPDRPPAPVGAIAAQDAIRGRGAGEKSPARARRWPGAGLDQRPHYLAWLFKSEAPTSPVRRCRSAWPIRRGRGPSGRVSRRTKALAWEQQIEPSCGRAEAHALSGFVEDLGRRGSAWPSIPPPRPPTRPRRSSERAARPIGPDPITLMKAKKIRSPRGLAGRARAGRRAMANFLAWFATEAPQGRLTEIDAVERSRHFGERARR